MNFNDSSNCLEGREASPLAATLCVCVCFFVINAFMCVCGNTGGWTKVDIIIHPLVFDRYSLHGGDHINFESCFF